MKTRIRDSYTPKLGDYCNTLVVDKETGNQYLFDADGVWTLISTDEEGIVEEAVAQANAYTDDVAEGKVDKEEGKGLSENDFTDADKDKLDGIEAGAQENVIEVVKRNGATLPIVDKTVDVEVPTATSALTNDSGYITNAVDDLVNYYDKDETDTLIATEAETRDAADLDLQEQIDAISSSSDVVDVVGTYAELQNYDTSKLGNNDIIKVLTDETHDDAISYYRWNDTTETFTYIGSQGPFYTKSETDATFVPQTRTINGKGLNSDVVLTAADVNALPASTVIPTVNDATLTIKKNGTTVTTFTANSAQNATADISVPTKVSDLTNDLDFVEESDLAPVALSGAYADLTGKPSIPTKTSDLTNDSDFVSDANYVHTDNNFTTTLKNKLNGIAAGAEVNVQSDWNVTDTSSDAFIKNKPSIPTKTSDLTNDSGFITSAAVPTKTSDLTNDSGFITKNVSDLTNYYTETEVNGMFNALNIPTKTSDLVNDSGFLTTLPIASATTLGGVKIGSGINVAADGTISAAVASLDWANITNKPTNVSYWTNDAGYITSAALPTKTSDLTNDSGFITSAALPTKTSDLTNDSGFITSAVSNLTNYYTKSQTYTQGEVNSLLNAIVVPTKTSDLTNDGADGTSAYVEADDLAAVATSGSYTDLSDKPTIGNATLTIQKNGTNVQTFTANATSNKTANITVPTKTSDLTNDSNFVSNTDYATANTGGVVKVGGGLEITNGVLSATGGGTADAVEWDNVLNKPTFSTVATSGSYNDLSDKPTIPTVNNATLTIQRNSTNVGTFTANASSNKTINITVPTTAADVSALPASTKYGASITVSLNTTDYKMTTTLKDQDGNTLGTAQTVDLPLESVVVNGSYDNTNKKIVLTLQNGNTVDIPVGDLVAGLQTEITSTNKLSSDLVDDTDQTHKFMTSAEKTKLSGIAAGAEVNVQSDWNVTSTTSDAFIKNKPSIPTKTSDLTNDSNFVSDANYVHTDNNYTTAEKNKLSGIAAGAEVNVQANWTQTTTTADDYIKNKPTLATVATSGNYNDLSNKPTIPAAQVQSDWAQTTTTAVDFIKNKPTIPTVGNATLTIQKNGTNVQTFTANATSNKTANITVPTKTSDLTNDSNFVADASYVHTDNNYTTTEKNKLAGIAAGAEVNVQPDWNVTDTTSDAFIKNKPTIPTVNNGQLTIQKNGTNVATFTANQSGNATANITVPTKTSELTNDSSFVTSSGTVAKANQLTTPRTIAISGGATGTATSFSGASNISIPVTDVKDAYVTWGGKGLAGNISPDDMGCIDEFGHNKLAFLPASCIGVAYSTDGGSTWTDYGLTDAQKIAMVSTTGTWVYSGGSTGATSSNVTNLKLRIRIACGTVDGTAKLYTAAKKILFDATDPGSNAKVHMRYRSIANYKAGTETWTDISTDYDIRGGSGWNSIPFGYTFGGNMSTQTSQIGEFEFVFYNTQLGTWGHKKVSIGSVRLIGNTNWTMPSELARAGHLYTMDTAQNATFPANVKVTGSLQHGNYTYTLPNKNGTVAMTSDIPSALTVDSALSTTSTNPVQNRVITTELNTKASNTALAAKQDLLSPGNHIDITSDVISATGYVHSENPQAAAAASSTITGSMIANGTITADKLASGATVKLTMSTSDIGEGAPLAANTLYGVYL